MSNEFEYPDRMYIAEINRKDYERLKESDSPLIKGNNTIENKDLFILAMSIGVLESKREFIDKKKFGYIRTQYLSNDEMVMIKALAIWEENKVEILLNPKKVVTIAEEYANGGIKFLKDMVFSKGFYEDFSKHFEKLLMDKLTVSK